MSNIRGTDRPVLEVFRLSLVQIKSVAAPSREMVNAIRRNSKQPASGKIALDDAPVDRGQRDEVFNRRALVDLMHGLADQPEFEHRAVILNKARVGCAAS